MMNRFVISLLVGLSLSVVILLLELVASPSIASPSVQTVNDAEVSDLTFAQLLAQQIAALEVQKLLLQAIYTSDHPNSIELQDQQDDLRRQFNSLPVSNKAEILNQAVVQAIESQLVQLQTEYAQNRNLFNDQHPFQQLTTQRIRNLQQAIAVWRTT